MSLTLTGGSQDAAFIEPPRISAKDGAVTRQRSKKSRFKSVPANANNYFDRKVRLKSATGNRPASTSASAGKAASPRRSSRASW